jgi:hypothetical protein
MEFLAIIVVQTGIGWYHFIFMCEGHMVGWAVKDDAPVEMFNHVDGQ